MVIKNKKYYALFLSAIVVIVSFFTFYAEKDKRDIASSKTNNAIFINTTRQALLSREALIRAETKSYFELTFISRYNKKYTKYHLSRLRDLARKGVEVNLLLDYYGSADITKDENAIPKGVIKHLMDEGVNIKFFNQYKKKGYTSLNTLAYRTHSKLMYFDSLNSAIIGDRNISSKYFSIDTTVKHQMRSFEGLFEVNDLILRTKLKNFIKRAFNSKNAKPPNFNLRGYKVSSEEVLQAKKDLDASKAFFKARYSRRNTSKKIKYSYWKSRFKPAENLDFLNNFGENNKYHMGTSSLKLIDDIGNAKKSVELYTPYVALNKENKRAVEKAIENGVDVKLYVGTSIHLTDEQLSAASIVEDLRKLRKMGVQVYIVDHDKSSSIIHKKVYMIDDKAFIGSANFNNRSQKWDDEIMITIKDKARVDEIRSIFRQSNERIYSKVTDNMIEDYNSCISLFKKVISRYVIKAFL